MKVPMLSYSLMAVSCASVHQLCRVSFCVTQVHARLRNGQRRSMYNIQMYSHWSPVLISQILGRLSSFISFSRQVFQCHLTVCFFTETLRHFDNRIEKEWHLPVSALFIVHCHWNVMLNWTITCCWKSRRQRLSFGMLQSVSAPVQRVSLLHPGVTEHNELTVVTNPCD